MSSPAIGEKLPMDGAHRDYSDARSSVGVDTSRPSYSRQAERNDLYRRVGKRAFDVVLASLSLLAFAPLILGLALVVFASDRSNPFFSHTRVGKDGRRFGCLKLRSMVVGAEAKLAALLKSDPVAAAEWAETQKLENDPRVTGFGRFLRRSSLDELPQLLNVLKGEMSLVGPRPVTEDEIKRYGASAVSYMRVRPGLTGMWQTMGRNDLSYADRVQLDVDYERSLGFLLDIKIIVMTAFAILRATGK